MPHDRASLRKRALLLAALAAVLLLLWLLAWTARSPARVVSVQAGDDASDASVPTDVAAGDVVGEGSSASPRAPEPTRAPRPAVLVRGHVTDRKTGEPISELELLLRSSAFEARTTTEADGGFAISGGFVLAQLVAEIFDAGEPITKVKRPSALPAADDWEIEIEIGPTVPVLIAVRDQHRVDPAQWMARIVETARPEDSAGEIQVWGNALRMLRPCEGCADREWSWLSLRGGPIPFIRYPRAQFLPDRTYRPLLAVESSERLQHGLSHLRSTVGVQPPAIVDPLQRFIELEGGVVDEDGKPFDNARVIALPPESESGGTARTPQWRAGHTDGLGRFRLRDLAIGRTVLCAYARERPAVVTSVDIDVGRNVLAEPLCLKAPRRRTSAAGPERAVAARADPAPRKSTDRVQSYLRLRLACVGRYERAWVLERSEREDTFRPFDPGDLPAGLPADQIDYAWIEEADPRPRWSPARWPQHGDLLVPEHVDLGIGQEGEPLTLAGALEDVHKTWVSFEAGGALIGCIGARELDRIRLPRGGPLDWAVWQRGCAPVFGRRSDLAQDDGGVLVLRAQPSPGWGAVLWFRARERSNAYKTLEGLGYIGEEKPGSSSKVCSSALAAPPLPAVRVLADGELAATSDPEGVARLACARPPQRLVLVAEGWHIAELEHLGSQSSSPVVRYVAWMERD